MSIQLTHVEETVVQQKVKASYAIDIFFCTLIRLRKCICDTLLLTRIKLMKIDNKRR